MSYYGSISNILLIETKENRHNILVQKAAKNSEVGYKYYMKDIIIF